MTLLAKYLPQATPLDHTEDPPGSTDPLGTLSTAERIAEILFPGFTARMWRPRLLTFAAIASMIAERVASRLKSGPEEKGLEARLGFERLFVSAMVRHQLNEPAVWKHAIRRLPGTRLASSAYRSDDTPLGRNNFLKGQAINGPYGVIARLARHLGVVDEDDSLGRVGEELLLAWARDEGMYGLFDENNNGTPGRQWLDRLEKATTGHVVDGQWRTQGWQGWQEVAKNLRLDKIGRNERLVLRRMLDSDPVNARCLELLSLPRTISLYRSSMDNGVRNEPDRTVLFKGVLPRLSVDESEEDKTIELAILLSDAYEHIASLMEIAFNSLLWGVTCRGGRARPDELQADARLQPVFRSVCRQLMSPARRMRKLIERVHTHPKIGEVDLIKPLDELASQASIAAENPERLIEVVIGRHRAVQSAKGKGMWIEPGMQWILMPGFGSATDEPPVAEVIYLHTFRVPNVYSFLGDLGLKGVEVPNEEA